MNEAQRQYQMNEAKDYMSVGSNNQHEYMQTQSQADQSQKQGIYKQSEIPIYDRFRNLDVNLPRK